LRAEVPRARARLARASGLRGGAVVALGALVLAGCALTSTPVDQGRGSPYVDTPFTAEGRLSARHARDAVAVNFAWTHAPPRDDLAVTSPLGQTVAELSGDASAGRVQVRTADGRRAEATDWTTLTERALGFPLPVSGLSAWIRGAPHPGTPHTTEVDREGRVALLRQDGWEVVYDYADAAGRLPRTLRIAYPDFEIRVVVDTWR
jgi:outer membrane lipoprotein LolB